MPYGTATHVNAMLRGPLAVPVRMGTLAARGFLDRPDRIVTDPHAGAVQTRVTTLTLATDSIPGLAVNATIEADGRSYRVRQIDLTDDGALTECLLAEV